jgi:LacI family transcriptional regulator
LGADLVLLHFGEDWRKECSGFVYVNPMQEQLDRSPWFGSRSNGATGGRLKTPPVVVLGASFRRDGVPSIDTDNADMAAQAVKHLAELGHQRIAYVGGGGDLSNNIDRYQGFVSACVRTGLRPDQRLVVREPGWRLDDSGNGRAALHAMLRSSERPTAVFAAGYYYALDVYAAAAHVGLSIPGNLSVVGVDDPPSSAHLSPPLTTLRQPLEQLGRLAARRLHDAVCGGEDDGVATLLPAQMVVRGSTGTAETPGENR